jgi:hypothetical protein
MLNRSNHGWQIADLCASEVILKKSDVRQIPLLSLCSFVRAVRCRFIWFMREKRLIKKIRRLETRLQKGATKLANLKRKLRAVEAAKLAKAKRKSSARTRKALTAGKVPIQTVEQRLMAMTAPKPEGTRRGNSFKRVKKKRYLTPERRAQLSAAMKARWAAKRAAAVTPEPISQEQTVTPEETSQQ